jgi:hypothetical protein
MSSSLTVPVSRGSQPQHFSIAADRWARARTLLHDDASATIADRVAACLVLLYAQPVTRIVALTTEHVRTGDDGDIHLHLGKTGLAVLPELALLLAQLPCELPPGAARGLAYGTWLFPGRRPGHPLHPSSICRRVRALGVDPRPDRNSALLEMARQLPPAVVGRLLGLHPVTAARWADTAGGNWPAMPPTNPTATADDEPPESEPTRESATAAALARGSDTEISTAPPRNQARRHYGQLSGYSVMPVRGGPARRRSSDASSDAPAVCPGCGQAAAPSP